jgi:hypothetical protein
MHKQGTGSPLISQHITLVGSEFLILKVVVVRQPKSHPVRWPVQLASERKFLDEVPVLREVLAWPGVNTELLKLTAEPLQTV